MASPEPPSGPQAPPQAPQAPPAPQGPCDPDTPAYELPSWSRHQSPVNINPPALQQLWLQCPDSVALLLQLPSAVSSSSTPPGLQGNSSLNRVPSTVASAVRRDRRVATESTVPAELVQEAASLGANMQHSMQMLACNAPNAGASMLHNALLLLQQLQRHTQQSQHAQQEQRAQQAQHGQHAQHAQHARSLPESAAGNHKASQYAWDTASQAVVSGCFDVLGVLVAHDKSCQQVVQRSMSAANRVSQSSVSLCVALRDQ